MFHRNHFLVQFCHQPSPGSGSPRLARDRWAVADARGPVLRVPRYRALGRVGRRLVDLPERTLGLDHSLDVGRLPHLAAPQLLDVGPGPLVKAEPRTLLLGLSTAVFSLGLVTE